jgi:hypothetical protein
MLSYAPILGLGVVMWLTRTLARAMWRGLTTRGRWIFSGVVAFAILASFASLGLLPQPLPYWVLIAWLVCGGIGWFLQETMRMLWNTLRYLFQSFSRVPLGRRLSLLAVIVSIIMVALNPLALPPLLGIWGVCIFMLIVWKKVFRF